MKNDNKTKEQLINELAGLRQQVAELVTLESERKRAEEEQTTSVARAIDDMGNGVIRVDMD